MYKMEVLARCLADHTWEVAVLPLADALGSFGVELVEDVRGADEAEGGEFAVVVDGFGDGGSVAIHQLDHTFGQAGFE
jgi:hypothetical protein